MNNWLFKVLASKNHGFLRKTLVFGCPDLQQPKKLLVAPGTPFRVCAVRGLRLDGGLQAPADAGAGRRPQHRLWRALPQGLRPPLPLVHPVVPVLQALDLVVIN